MKKLIFYGLLFFFLAVTFVTDTPPPGWYQQTLPVSKTVNDIFFIDSLNGWIVASNISYPNPDTGYIMRTTNGGNNWTIQLDSLFNYYAVQFLDLNNGYAAGGTGRAKFLKTTNGGINWTVTTPFGSNMYAILDVAFVNNDTGWICGDDTFGGGIYKTTNGGANWIPQAGPLYRPQKLFFINRDTGWAGSNEANGKLYRTTNGGQVWELIYTYNTHPVSYYFINGLYGWTGGAGTGNGIQYTTNGGFNWINSQGYTGGGYDIKFINDSIGYTGRVPQVLKSTDGGKIWGYQNTPPSTYTTIGIVKGNTNVAWAGGYYSIIHTSDGGGPITYTGIKSSSTFVTAFELKQNYPNPFNPSTTIDFEVQKPSRISLKVFTIDGREVDELLDYEKFSAGYYYVDFNAVDLSSGVYLYQMTGWTEDKREIFIDTKKMVLLK